MAKKKAAEAHTEGTAGVKAENGLKLLLDKERDCL